MCLDDFSLAGEAEVSSVLLTLMQLAQVRGNVLGGETHPSNKFRQNKYIHVIKDKIERDGLFIY